MKLIHEPMPAGEHRPDIEGLRALAVIAVLLFHLNIQNFSGGFVGVDIFFVISGFLIGGIVVREVQSGSFRLSDYFVRRVRRIVPVMLLVLGVVTIAAIVLLLPSELVDYGWSLGFSALFLSNFHFWLHRGAYAESEHEVLLHMWTLGVEGQFYILLPLMVLGLMKLGRTGLWVGLVILAALSAASSILLPWASFYMLPARLWEFLLGMMVAITPLPFLAWRWVREGLALGGFALIVFSVTTFHIDMPFPGWRAAIPCIGAAALIAAGTGEGSLISKALTIAPVRFVGKISYSLYLWHWPIIVLLLLGLPAVGLTPALQILAAGLSFVLAVLSWKFVEEPFRGGQMGRRTTLWVSVSACALLVALATTVSFQAGWPWRFTDRGQQIAASMDYPINDVFRSGSCFIHSPTQAFDEDACLVTDDSEPNVLLIGDSHAAHLAPGLSAAFPRSAISQVTAAGCRPVLSPEYDQGSNIYPFCAELIQRGWMIAESSRPDLIILAGRWERGDLPALSSTLGLLRDMGHEVLLIGPAAEWTQFVPRLLLIAHEREAGSEVPDAMQLKDRAELDLELAAVAAQEGVSYFSMLQTQCPDSCLYFGPSGNPLIIDNSHFTHEASELFAGEIEHSALVR